VNLRKDCYRPDLVADLLHSAQVVKLSDSEVVELGAMLGLTAESPAIFCRENASRFGWEAVCVTRGKRGCTAWIRGELTEAAGCRVPVADTVGAGDAFAAAFLQGLDAGWSAPEVARFANRVGALIASRPGGTPKWTLSDLDVIR
jgi:fructokinase